MYGLSVEVSDNTVKNPLHVYNDCNQEEAYTESGSGDVIVDIHADEGDGGYMDIPSGGAYTNLPEAEEGLYDDL